MTIEVLIFPFGEPDPQRKVQPITRFYCGTWEINLDLLSDATSSFNVPREHSDHIKFGNRVMVRYIDYKDWNFKGNQNLIFFGYIESYDDDVMTCRDYRSYFKKKIVTIPKDLKDPICSDPESYVVGMISRWFSQWNDFADAVRVTPVGSGVKWEYQNTTIGLKDFSSLLETIFKQYQVLPMMDDYEDHPEFYNAYQVRMKVGPSQDPKVPLDTAATDQDLLDIYIKERGPTDYNAVTVVNGVDWSTKNVYSESFTRGTDHAIHTCVLYDPEAHKDPDTGVVVTTMEDYGKQFLVDFEYNHEITFGYSASLLPNAVPLTLGQRVDVKHEGQHIPSVISSITYNSEKGLAVVKCGNVRTKLEMLLDDV